jgi:asparagine synthase (glutamine-hydrolysing)
MCGIVGQLNFNGREVDRDVLKEMAWAVSHRGPDDDGLYIDGYAGLGHRRLAIIDLSEKGRQPMADDKGEVYIVFNGEIYNFKELRCLLEEDGVVFSSGTDTETIIYLYKKYSFDCLKYLRGMFAFAIWDSRKKLLFIARDRLGKKPLKYYQDGNSFIFASELKAILKNPAVKKEIDYQAIDEYLSFKYVPGPKTGFKNIKKLAPGHFLVIKYNGEVSEKSYWDLNFEEKDDLREEEWLERIEKKIKESVALRLTSDVPLGAHLSGGIDSGLITALMAENTGKRIKTFSIGFEESKYNELPFARLVAERYDTDHHEFIVKPDAAGLLPKIAYYYEEPYADASAIPYWHLSEITKKHITVALNGDGGDENFAGYERHLAPQIYRSLKMIPAKHILSKIFSAFSAKSEKTGKIAKALAADKSSLFAFYLDTISYFTKADKKKLYANNFSLISEQKFDFPDIITANNDLDKILQLGLITHLPDDLLVKADIASMAHGLEMRSPLLDNELTEMAARIPTDLKMKDRQKKYLLKKIAVKYLPHECVYRPKHGFTVPLNYWFKGKMQNFLQENILSSDFIETGFNKYGIEHLLKDHQNNRQNNENKLYALLMLSLWKKEWFK